MTTLRKISEALLDGWPNVQTRCDSDTSTDPLYKLGRVDRQSYGSRFMLGIVSLGDAARYGLRSAALETRNGHVRRADRRLARGGAEADASRRSVRRRSCSTRPTSASRGRPTRARWSSTPRRGCRTSTKDDAAKVAQFIRVSTTEGQRPGQRQRRAARRLPADQRRRASTRQLYDSAQDVAAAVEAQKKPGRRRRPTTPSGTGGGAPDGGADTRRRTTRRRGDDPSAAPSPSATPSAAAGGRADAGDPGGRVRPRRRAAPAADPARR